jgi:PAS domain S-box-containing protein
MNNSSHLNDELIQLFIVTAATIGAILTSIFSLSHGIYEVFPFLYILPIILVVYFYPKYGVPYSLGISLVYLGLVFLFVFSSPTLIAISMAWFAIFIVLGVVTSSYANQLHDEKKKIKKVLENAQDGIFCFESHSMRLRDINQKCARMLDYEREDLLGKAITQIWTSEEERADFISGIKGGQYPYQREIFFRTRDGTPRRLLISAILSTNNLVFCSAIDITDQKITDEEIRQALEDLERQVRDRTAHLEKINEDLKKEILERRRIDTTLLKTADKNDERESAQ